MARTVQVSECLGGETPDYPKNSMASKVPVLRRDEFLFTNYLNKYSESWNENPHRDLLCETVARR
jgi:hypothetical protein